MISVRLHWMVLGSPHFRLRVLGNLLTITVSPLCEQAVTHDWYCSLSWEEMSFISFWRPMCHLLCLLCCPGFLFGSRWIQCLREPALVSTWEREISAGKECLWWLDRWIDFLETLLQQSAHFLPLLTPGRFTAKDRAHVLPNEPWWREVFVFFFHYY